MVPKQLNTYPCGNGNNKTQTLCHAKDSSRVDLFGHYADGKRKDSRILFRLNTEPLRMFILEDIGVSYNIITRATNKTVLTSLN